MPYSPTDWVDGVTPVDATRLDKIEAGIVAAEEASKKGQANGYASLDGSALVPDAQIPAGIARDSEVTSAISTHAAAADPHTGYQKESEKGVANGYASLDSGGLVPSAQLPVVAGVPAGAMIDYGGSSAPSGWLLCDGASVLRADYPALFAAIGVAWGSVDGTHFNLPNMKGKASVGLDSAQTEFDVLGESGGAKTVTLSTAQIPSHNHGGGTGAAGYHAHTIYWHDGGSTITGLVNRIYGHGGSTQTDEYRSQTDEPVGDHSHTIPSEGGGGSHTNLQPYAVVQKIIKT